MVKIIIQQENEDGTKTIAFKDSEGKTMVSVITGKTPYVIDKQLVVKDKLKEILSGITKEVSERMLVFSLLSKIGMLSIGEICSKIKLDYGVSDTYLVVEKALLILEKIGLVKRKELGRLSLYYTEGEE